MTRSCWFPAVTVLSRVLKTPLIPGERLVMSTAQGPFPMETTYTWQDAGDRATRMTLRNRGEPAGFAKIAAPMMARAMRRAMTADLVRLSNIVQTRASLLGPLSGDEVSRIWRDHE